MGRGPSSAQEEIRPSLGGIDDQQGHNFEETLVNQRLAACGGCERFPDGLAGFMAG